MNKKLTGIVAGAAGAALLLSGATYALWSDSATVDGGTIAVSGNLDVAVLESAWVDASDDRTDNPHDIDLTSFKIIPGDTIVGSFGFDVGLEGDNMLAALFARRRRSRRRSRRRPDRRVRRRRRRRQRGRDQLGNGRRARSRARLCRQLQPRHSFVRSRNDRRHRRLRPHRDHHVSTRTSATRTSCRPRPLSQKPESSSSRSARATDSTDPRCGAGRRRPAPRPHTFRRTYER